MKMIVKQSEYYLIEVPAADQAKAKENPSEYFGAMNNAVAEAKHYEVTERKITFEDGHCSCPNCHWTGETSDMKRVFPDIPDLGERVAPGEPVPEGECPLCGALCHKSEPKRHSEDGPKICQTCRTVVDRTRWANCQKPGCPRTFVHMVDAQ